MATKSMILTIAIEHVFVAFIGPMDETTIQVNLPQIKHSKNPELTLVAIRTIGRN